MRLMRRAVPLIAALAALALPALASAKASDVIKDCTDDEVLQGHYTQRELRNALAGLDADADEYTNCRAVIRQAQLALASGSSSGNPPGGGGGGTSSGGGGADESQGGGTSSGSTGGVFGGFPTLDGDGAATATPAEREAIADAVEEVSVKDPVEKAGVSLPTPLIGALAIGALALLVFVALDIRRRLVDRRGA
jgi:hypothetical protein